jgi:hypothetical protein
MAFERLFICRFSETEALGKLMSYDHWNPEDEFPGSSHDDDTPTEKSQELIDALDHISKTLARARDKIIVRDYDEARDAIEYALYLVSEERFR